MNLDGYSAIRRFFLLLLVVTLVIALSIIYTIASIKTGDFSWHPFAHDMVRHTLESSAL